MLATDLMIYKSKTVGESSSNGGREGYTALTPAGPLDELFPSVTEEERAAGLLRWRKVFFHNLNLADQILQNARIFIKSNTTGEDFYYMIAGTQRNTQGDLTGTEKKYASGKLSELANAGQAQIKIAFDNATYVTLAAADMLWLYGTNGQTFAIITGTPSWNGNVATCNLTAPLNVAYPINSLAAMVIPAGTLQPSVASWAEHLVAATYDETTYPLVLKNKGTVDDDWTFTFLNATQFQAVGLYEGNVGAGDVTHDFAPINPATGTAYFTLRYAGWGGTPAVGDYITATTHPSSYPVFMREVVPAGAAQADDNVATLRLHGE